MTDTRRRTNVALLIVDVQKGFIRRPFGNLVEKIERLQIDYDTVFVTKFFNDDPSNFRTLIGWDRLSRDSVDFELAFKPINHAIVLEKSIYSCVNPQFISGLLLRNIDEIHICGIDTDICVTKCAVDLFENGFRPVVLSEYCATNAGDVAQSAALEILKRYIGKSQVL